MEREKKKKNREFYMSENIKNVSLRCMSFCVTHIDILLLYIMSLKK